MVISNQRIPLEPLYAQEDQPGVWSVYFKRPANFIFQAGDWVDLEFNNRELLGGKTYSLSSSPTETDLRISFREGMSGIKKALQGITSSDSLMITQYGNDYKFQLNKHQPSVLIAGGIGIAPFRSMLKEMYDNGDKNGVMLIYLNQNEQFLFGEELEQWNVAMNNLTIHYIVTKGVSRKKREKQILSLLRQLNQNFYISGPPAMVENNEHLLIDSGVAIRDIRIDSFGGY